MCCAKPFWTVQNSTLFNCSWEMLMQRYLLCRERRGRMLRSHEHRWRQIAPRHQWRHKVDVRAHFSKSTCKEGTQCWYVRGLSWERFNTSNRSFAVGTGSSISRSRRPGLRKAASKRSLWLVVAKTKTRDSEDACKRKDTNTLYLAHPNKHNYASSEECSLSGQARRGALMTRACRRHFLLRHVLDRECRRHQWREWKVIVK